MSVSSQEVRNVLRHFPSGVTIVTIKSPESSWPHGLTVSAFTSISTEPPLIMVAINHKATAHTLLQAEKATFAVNILAQDQAELSDRFAWLKVGDRFAAGNWETAVTGTPILKDALAWLDCNVYAHYLAGTHTIYIGEIVASGIPRPEHPPLVYWNRGYRYLVSGQQ